MARDDPIQGIGEFNQELESLIERGIEGGLGKARITSLLGNQITAFGSQMMREESGGMMQTAKGLREAGQTVSSLGRALRR